MKARTVGVDVGTPVVVAAEVLALAAFVALPPARFGWWPALAITAAAVVLLVPTLHRRNLPAWVAARSRWRAQRGRDHVTAAAVDVPHGNIVCGVRVEPSETLTMIEVTGKPYSLTFLRGSTVSLTRNALPLEVLTELLDQPGGLKLAIDIVPAGHRVRRGNEYPPLYSTLLADRPAAGQRTVQFVVRLDLRNSLPGLQYRHSIGAAAAAATERIINALLERDIRASALSAAELDAALDRLGAGLQVAPSPPVSEPAADDNSASAPLSATRTTTRRRTRTGDDVGWRTVKGHPGFLTTYYFSPEDITTSSLHQMWSLRSDEIVLTLSLFKRRYVEAPDGDGPVMIAATVRTNDPQPPQQPPTMYLNTLPGDQYAAAVRPAPTARPSGLQIPSRPLGDPARLEIPLGATGILIGAALRDDRRADLAVQRDDLVMLALTDPQQATRIVMDTGEYYVRQLLIRAAAVGERIAIYSSQPDRWARLAQPNIAVVERRRPAEFVPSIIVNDRSFMPPPAGLSATVITLGHGQPSGQQPDIHFRQISRESVRITTAAETIEVAVSKFNQEQAFLGL